jgi:type VI secretion system secreted protein VgrG
MAFKSGAKELAGPGRSNPTLPDMPRSKLYAGHFQVLEKSSKEPMPGRLYRKQRADGTVIFGRTDQNGHTQKVVTAEPQDIKIVLDRLEKFHRSKIEESDVSDWFNGSNNGE